MAHHAGKSAPPELLQERPMKGYVTQLSALIEQDPHSLADRLGYAHHLMANGYALFVLLSPVARQDFVWRDTTRFSAGWVKERVYFKEQNRLRWSDEYVQRADQDRFRFHQSDGRQSDHAWDAFLAEQQRLLNVRSGPERIVKVRPLVEGIAGDYPDARDEGVRQWEFRVDKQFFCVAMVKQGRMIRRGEFDHSRSA